MKWIVFSVFIVFLSGFGLFFIVYNANPAPTVDPNHQFFSQSFSSDEKKVFLMGSSHVGQIKTELINNDFSKQNKSYEVYNLAFVGNKPKTQQITIDSIIKLNPELIVYGISYRDFTVLVNHQENQLPDPHFTFNQFLESIQNKDINPKFFTLQIIRDLFEGTSLFPEQIKFLQHNAPFYEPQKVEFGIMREEIGQKKIIKNKDIFLGNISENTQLNALTSIIDKLKKNNIELVIFLTPLHQVYLDSIFIDEKEKFQMIVDTLQKNNVTVYDLTEKYQRLQIWSDYSHISLNENVTSYSEDIGKIILKELDD